MKPQRESLRQFMAANRQLTEPTLGDLLNKLQHSFIDIEPVKHHEVYRPVEENVEFYQLMEQEHAGSGLTRDLFCSIYLGISNGLVHIVHAAKQPGIMHLKEIIDNPEYAATLAQRINYMDSLVQFANKATVERKAQLQDVKGEVGYNSNKDLAQWQTVCNHYRQLAGAYQEMRAEQAVIDQKGLETGKTEDAKAKIADRYESRFQKHITFIEQAGNKFLRATNYVMENSIPVLFK